MKAMSDKNGIDFSDYSCYSAHTFVMYECIYMNHFFLLSLGARCELKHQALGLGMTAFGTGI